MRKRFSNKFFARLSVLSTSLAIVLGVALLAERNDPIGATEFQAAQAPEIVEVIRYMRDFSVEAELLAEIYLWMDKYWELVNEIGPRLVAEYMWAREAEPTGEWVSLGEFRITHYCTESHHHICNDGDPTTTATGNTPIAYRTIAVDPTVIPYGSLIRIDGSYREYLADDTGGAIRGNRIDRLVTYHDQAMQYGVIYAEVWIWVEGGAGDDESED